MRKIWMSSSSRNLVFAKINSLKNVKLKEKFSGQRKAEANQ